MKVIYKAPGCAPEPRDIPNTLEELQATVGGYIETVTFASDALVICNEEGRLQGLPHIAHELFHEMDADRAISSGLTLAIAQDQVSLNMASNGDIKAYLQMKYPNAVRTKKSGDIALNNPYRGIADILNGMSGGKEWYGFGHSKKYWKTPGNLEAEAWAQFGRTYYNNDPDVKKMFEDIFPNLSTHAMMALKGLI